MAEFIEEYGGTIVCAMIGLIIIWVYRELYSYFI